MIAKNVLIGFGANPDEGIERCMGDESFYLKMVCRAIERGPFEKLLDVITGNNLDEAFERAHALKGVLGNLSLTPLFDLSSELTELLRNKLGGYEAPAKKLIEKRDELAALLSGLG